MKNGFDKLSDSPDMLFKECIEITEEQMHGLKGEETADAREKKNSLVGLAISLALYMFLSGQQQVETERERVTSLHPASTRRVTTYDLRKCSEHSPLIRSKGGHSLHSIKHSSSQLEDS